MELEKTVRGKEEEKEDEKCSIPSHILYLVFSIVLSFQLILMAILFFEKLLILSLHYACIFHFVFLVVLVRFSSKNFYHR